MTRLVQLDGDVLGEEKKVFVCGQNRHFVSARDRADQKVCVGPLNARAATEVEELRGAFVVMGVYCQIRECSEGVTQSVKLRF